MIRSLPLRLFLALALGALATLAVRVWLTDDPVEFKVGTWNLEFLGAGGNFRNNLPNRDDSDLKKLGEKVRELGVVVLAVQEVNDEATLRKVAAAAGPRWRCKLGTAGEWDDKKTAQRIGFLWNGDEVDLLLWEELLQLPRIFDGKPIFHRVPVSGVFRHKKTGSDFRLVTVHLKAGRKPDDEQKRSDESKLLTEWLDGLQQSPNEDQDIILLGDFNCTYGSHPQEVLQKSTLRKWLDAERIKDVLPIKVQIFPLDLLVPIKRRPRTIMHFPEPIDQIVVANACTEVLRNSIAIDGDFDRMKRNEWRKIYSDHFPVTVTLRAHADDDEAAWRFDTALGDAEVKLEYQIVARPARGNLSQRNGEAR